MTKKRPTYDEFLVMDLPEFREAVKDPENLSFPPSDWDDGEEDEHTLLSIFAIRGDVERVRILLEAGIRPMPKRPMLGATGDESPEAIVHWPDFEFGYDAVHHAIRKGNVDVLRTLLEFDIRYHDWAGEVDYGQLIGHPGPYLRLALDRVLDQDLRLTIMRLLLEDGFRPAERVFGDVEHQELTVMQLAAVKERIPDMQLMLEYDNDDTPLLEPDPWQNNSLLHHAARASGPASLEFLLAQPAIPEQVHTRNREEGQLPLHFAAAAGVPRNAELLLKAGAEVDARDNDGNSALHLVAPVPVIRDGAVYGVRREWTEDGYANKGSRDWEGVSDSLCT